MLALGVGIFVLGVASGWWFAPLPAKESHPAPTPSAAAQGANFSTAESDRPSRPPVDFFSRLNIASGIRLHEKRVQEFFNIAADLDATQIQDAIARVEKLRIGDRDEVMAQLFARWGELDPHAAMAAAQALSRAAERERAANAVLGGWIENDPRAAEQWVTALPEGALKSSASKTLIGALAVSDPPHALALAQERKLAWQASEEIVGTIFDAWIGNNAPEAAAHAAQLPPGELRAAALRRVAGEWARVDLPQALAWADSVPDQEFTAGSMNTFGTGPLFSVLRTWVDGDSAAAVRWLQQLPEGDKRASLVSSAATFLRSAGPTPEIATQLALMLPEGTRRDNALQGFAQQIASWQPDAALAWVRGQSDPELRRVILSGLLSHLSGSALLDALQFAQTLDVNGKEGVIAVETMGGRSGWGLADPASLADWAVRQPNNQQYLNRIASSWIDKDADRAAAWLQTLPTPARDEALHGVVNAALSRISSESPFDTAAHFQRAERWIALLSSEPSRQSSYELLAERWLAMDADAARAWIDVSPLPAATKTRLLQAKP